MANSWAPDGKALLDTIKSDSRKRRAAPIEFFRVFLRDQFKDNTYEEAKSLWSDKAEHFPWYADDALYCISAVIENPPRNLVEIMQEEGWLMLSHDGETGDSRPFSESEYLDWLKNMYTDFKSVYDSLAK